MILLTFSLFCSSLDDLSAGPLFCGLENMGSNFLCPSNGSEKKVLLIIKLHYKLIMIIDLDGNNFLPGKNSDA